MARLKLSDPVVRARHVARYCACFVPAVLASGSSPALKAAFVVALAASHYATDGKRWLLNEDWTPGTIINDQPLHALLLAVLGRLL